jgi:hypothetical protein
MRYAITLPNMQYDPLILADLACDAEAAGWDGVFVWTASICAGKKRMTPGLCWPPSPRAQSASVSGR